MDLKKDWLDVAKEVILRPKKFFENMPTSGGFREPFTFLLINTLIAGTLLAALNSLGGFCYSGICIYMEHPMIVFIQTLIGGTLQVFIYTAIAYVFLRLFGAKGTYEATFRVVAYLSAFNLLAWIPIAGYFIVFYWMYLGIIGYSHVHEMTKSRVLAALMCYAIAVFATEYLISYAIHSYYHSGGDAIKLYITPTKD